MYIVHVLRVWQWLLKLDGVGRRAGGLGFMESGSTNGGSGLDYGLEREDEFLKQQIRERNGGLKQFHFTTI